MLKKAKLLNVIGHLSINGKNVKQKLETCFKLGIICVYPKNGDPRVASNMKILALNVFSVFSS